VKATFGKDTRRGLDDLRRAAALACMTASRWESDDIHCVSLGLRLPAASAVAPGTATCGCATKTIVLWHAGDLSSIYRTIENI
jgi:hypothetical protein